jgi:hypothetical protein
MNYLNALAREHSRATTDRISKAIGNDPEEFKKIINIIYSEVPPLPQRASWVLALVSEKHPELIRPYVSKFISTIASFKIDGIKRNMMLALASQSIPEKYQPKLIDACFDFILSPDEAVALKVHSMQVLANFCKQHPELKIELKAAIEDQLPKTTAAFFARAKRILQELK